MKAIVLSNPGSPSHYSFDQVPAPSPLPGHVTIKVKAFGLNHAEMHMRRGEWAETHRISGIEFVGIVTVCPNNEFPVGAKVAALMGGMGRTIAGSYAEYTRVPASNFALIESNLSWEDLAVIPESYATAWTCLFRNLELERGETLLVRGGTSAFGLAAINLAVEAGAKVIATTRNLNREKKLLDLGVKRVILESHTLSAEFQGCENIDKILNLVGNSVLLDSMHIPRRGGSVCLAGFLGGLDPIPEFNPLAQLPSGVQFSFFGSFHFGTPGFALSDVPLQKIASDVEAGKYEAKPVRVFNFEKIDEAHILLEVGAGGKIVVTGVDKEDA
ncbi:hypothetical protein HYALB_00001248 [Hymenoscyphus albidus]|uniref:Enoyl reductase (ER) domain-containing protein n=1 Tax=Hymenoscyphus albidus TaxID=595503 RepID=A0A9N9LCR2_9HELO|nr:hypothetical protein HYALB_00001248 [Hymenoscyphus albidus]